MDFLSVVYLAYVFVAFYFLSIYILLYFQNKRRLYDFVKPEREYSLSIVVPCYNEADSIGKNIEALLSQDYKGLKKIIVVDDCSTDNSFEIIKKYAKKYSKVMALQTPKNTGCAAGPKNYGSKFVKTELVGFSDADSFPKKDAASKMVGFFNDPKMGAVTSRVLVLNRNNKLSKIQAIEYKVIAFTRKLLGFIDSIYVANGPLSIYRMTGFKEVGGFDEKNLTEDIELTWHFVEKGWKIEMSLPADAPTIVPEKFKQWFRQRIRWNVGGIQTVMKYKSKILQMGMLGLFIIPFFVLSWFLGIFGLFFLIYRLVDALIVKFLILKYSLSSQVAIIRAGDFSLNPSILFFFGLIFFIVSLAFTLVSMFHSREEKLSWTDLLDIFIYSFFYLLVYPPILIWSFYKYLKGEYKW